MLPKPPAIAGYPLSEEPDTIARTFALSNCFNKLSDAETKATNNVYMQLQEKRRRNSRVLDLGKMQDLHRSINLILTEFECRRLINLWEWEYIGSHYFILENGSKEWTRYDQGRAAQIQKRMEREDNKRKAGNHQSGIVS